MNGGFHIIFVHTVDALYILWTVRRQVLSSIFRELKPHLPASDWFSWFCIHNDRQFRRRPPHRIFYPSTKIRRCLGWQSQRQFPRRDNRIHLSHLSPYKGGFQGIQEDECSLLASSGIHSIGLCRGSDWFFISMGNVFRRKFFHTVLFTRES